jgi:hypothetical protein
MSNTNFIKLLGEPIDSPEIQNLIAKYQLEDEFQSVYKEIDLSIYIGGIAPSAHYNNETSGLIIRLSTKRPANKLTVDSFIIFNNFKDEFPLNITPEINYESVNFGSKIRKGKNEYDSYTADFLVDDAEVSVTFDSDKCFASVSVSSVEPGTLALMQFKSSLKKNRSLVADFTNAKVRLIRESPIDHWQTRMQAGDSIFTPSALAASNDAIHNYLNAVETAVAKKSAAQIVSATKFCVKSFNKINNAHNSFVETVEREELVMFIGKVVEATGIQLPANFDMTLEWREW